MLILSLHSPPFLRRVQQHVSSSRPEQGAIRQAMFASLGAESKEFYRFMALLQSQAAEPIPSPGLGSRNLGPPYLSCPYLRWVGFLRASSRGLRVGLGYDDEDARG